MACADIDSLQEYQPWAPTQAINSLLLGPRFTHVECLAKKTCQDFMQRTDQAASHKQAPIPCLSTRLTRPQGEPCHATMVPWIGCPCLGQECEESSGKVLDTPCARLCNQAPCTTDSSMAPTWLQATHPCTQARPYVTALQGLEAPKLQGLVSKKQNARKLVCSTRPIRPPQIASHA